ncbi:MAG: FlgD immunoglobulin-like domain containing protein [Bacteroidota bacterium]|nr:FlgD immunoglobulin-like domain containing protein [Bacteroidota bacterium]
MKNFFKLFTILLAVGLALSTTAWGQLITFDNFNYTDNSLLTDNGWTAHSGSGTNPVTVGASNGLTYSGYSGLTGVTGAVEGSAARLVNTGEDVSKLFTTVSSGTIYYSFLVNVTTGTAGYFLHLGNSATSFAARIYVKPSVTSGKINFGISNTSTASYSATPTDFNTSTTYLIIVKYDVSTTGSASLWVKASGVPATELDAGTQEHTTSGTGQATIERICLRQYDANQRIVVDGIRVGPSWATVFPATGVNQPPSITGVSRVTFVPAIGGTNNIQAIISDDGVITSAKLAVRVNGGNYDSSFTMSVLSGSTYQAVIPASKHVVTGDLVEYFVTAIDDSGAYTSTATSLQGYFIGDAPISSIKSKTLTSVTGYGARINGTLNIAANIFSNGSSYIQDATGGMRIFMTGMSSTLQAGRNAKVEGTVAARFNAFQLTTPNFTFVDTTLGTSTITPATITLPLTQSASNANEGRVVKVIGMSTDSTGTFAAGKTYIYREADNDTISVYIESNGTANTIVGRTIPTTPIDAVGVLAYYNTFLEIKPRSAEDFGLSGADGSGTATITPTSRLINLTAVAETLTVTGNGIHTLEGVSFQIPSTWTWTNTSSYALEGTGFSGATPAVTGDGSVENPYIITITGAAVTNINTGTIRIFNLNTPASSGLTTFTSKTRASGGTLTTIASSPTVNVTTLTFEAAVSGNWSNPATWSGVIVPGASDNVTMTTLNVTVTIDIPNAACNNLTMTGSGSAINSGPLLQFEGTGVRQLTVNGNFTLSGGSGGGGGTDRGGRPKLDANNNPDATLVFMKNVSTSSSNTTTNANGGLNMNEGTVKLLGASSDSLKNGAGLRLGNLIIGDGINPKTFVSVPSTSSRVAVRSITVKSNSSMILGNPASNITNTFGNFTETGVAMLSGGVTVESGASLTIGNATTPGQSAFINIKSGGLTNNGTLNLKSQDGSRKYNVAFGGLTADTSAVKQTVAGSATGIFANITVGRTDTQLDTLLITRSMNVDTMSVWDMIDESAGNAIVGLVRTTRTVAQGVNNNFGGIGIEINAAGAEPGSTVVERVTGVAQTGNGKNSILRYFNITPTLNTGLNAAFVFKYDNTELSGQDANTLQLFKSDDAGLSWAERGGVVNTTNRTVSLAGVNDLSRWTAADASNNIGGAFGVDVAFGWNMVSVPLTVADYSKAVLFPTATSSAFAYEGSYVNKIILENAVGYWLKFPSAQRVPMSGSPRTIDSVSVLAGWNMIGSLTLPFATNKITPSIGVVINSPYYGYNNGYQIATTIEPGKAYWVKVTTGGKLYLNLPPALGKEISETSYNLDVLNSITITDAVGSLQTLYFGSKNDANFPVEYFELPPQSPSGIFDVRFKSQRSVEIHPAVIEKTESYPVTISSAVYPITISWNMKNANSAVYKLSEIVGSKNGVTLSGSGSVKISDENVKSIQISVGNKELLPQEFSLGQNYPNPFNPSTRFNVALPQNAEVNVDVYDILGRKLASIVSGNLTAGNHLLEWNGQADAGYTVPSGIYFIKMTAKSQENKIVSFVRKATILK